MPLKWESVELKISSVEGERENRQINEERFTGLKARDWIWDKFKDAKIEDANKNFVLLKFEGNNFEGEKALEPLPFLYSEMNPNIESILTYEIKPESIDKIGSSKASSRDDAETILQEEPPIYEITLEIGNIDELFEPISEGATELHTEKGVQQRLQALGYFYTPLKHTEANNHAEKCWKYFRDVHEKKQSKKIEDAELLELLKREINGNLVTSKLLDSGEILDKSTLPKKGEFAAIRFPGGYGTSRPLVGSWKEGATQSTEFELPLGSQRWLFEKKVVDCNKLIGKIPLIAKVEKVFSNGIKEPAPGEKVYFQLLPPVPLEKENRFFASFLNNKVMDYSKNLPRIKNWEMGEKVSPRYRHMFKKFTPQIQIPEILGDGGAPPPPPGGAPPPPPGGAPPPPGDEEPPLPSPIMEPTEKQWMEIKLLANKIGQEAIASCRDLEKVVDEKILQFEKENRKESKKLKIDGTEDTEGGKFRSDNLVKQYTTEKDKAQENYKKAFVWKCEQLFDEANETPVNEATEFELYLPAIRSILDQLENKTVTNTGRKEDSKTYDSKKTFIAEGNDDGIIYPDIVFEIKPGKVTEILAASTPIEPFEIENRGPHKFVSKTLDDCKGSYLSENPQKFNASIENGGKGGEIVAGNIFETEEYERFNDGHSDYGAIKPASEAAAVNGRHKYAVVCESNEKGFAGVVFAPSSCGGDRYRLRAYVEPKEEKVIVKPSAETGTMTVWRNIRIAKVLRHDSFKATGHALPQKVIELFEAAPKEIPNGEYDDNDKHKKFKNPGFNDDWLETAKAFSFLDSSPASIAVKEGDALEKIYLQSELKDMKMRFRPIDLEFISVWENFRRCYCELICDYDEPEPISQEMMDAALENMITAVDAQTLKYKGPQGEGKIYPHNTGSDLKIKWSELVFVDEKSPYLLNFKHYHNYNQAIEDESETYQKLGEADIQTITSSVFVHGVQALAESLMDGGVYPGFTIIQYPHGDTWDHRNLNIGGMFSSGWAFSPRGAFVFYTEALHRNFMCYSATSNTVHELGHALGLPHQIPEPPSGDSTAHEPSPNFPNQTPKENETNCVMSYYGSYGEFCGKFVLAMRGWKVKVSTWGDAENLQNRTGETDGV